MRLLTPLMALILIAPAALAGADGEHGETRAYTYDPLDPFGPFPPLTNQDDCGDANTHCFTLSEPAAVVHVLIEDAADLPAGHGPRVAAWVTLDGPGFDVPQSGVACGDATIPTGEATDVSVRLLHAGSWFCDWCPADACGPVVTVSAPPTKGTITVTGYEVTHQ